MTRGSIRSGVYDITIFESLSFLTTRAGAGLNVVCQVRREWREEYEYYEDDGPDLETISSSRSSTPNATATAEHSGTLTDINSRNLLTSNL